MACSQSISRHSFLLCRQHTEGIDQTVLAAVTDTVDTVDTVAPTVLHTVQYGILHKILSTF